LGQLIAILCKIIKRASFLDVPNIQMQIEAHHCLCHQTPLEDGSGCGSGTSEMTLTKPTNFRLDNKSIGQFVEKSMNCLAF
jgi:hypothetical protein